jgi:hypothetical protein
MHIFVSMEKDENSQTLSIDWHNFLAIPESLCYTMFDQTTGAKYAVHKFDLGVELGTLCENQP